MVADATAADVPAATATPAASKPAASAPPAPTLTPPSPPDNSGPHLAYRPDFTQQHIRSVSMHRSQTPTRAYQGIKANVGTDSFMMAHNAKATSQRAASAQRARHERPQVPVNSYTMEYVKKTKESVGPRTKPRAPGDVPHIHSDTFMNNFVSKSRSLSPPGDSVRNRFNLGGGAKPHVSADSYALVAEPFALSYPSTSVQIALSSHNAHHIRHPI